MEPISFEFDLEENLFYIPIEVAGDYYADEYGNVAVVISRACIGSANVTKDIRLGLLADRIRNIIKGQILKENNYE
jgi:hypothetical protein